ncbi:uncharacterized protein LOC143875604 isoform X2 [Tasmannia lanceolata]|uniref:uncharacterized protein LOC143875604 isoform X2 n=1 Tax=Tasmannia lanceolata TaxID=3420 RepID=UPI0040634A2C
MLQADASNQMSESASRICRFCIISSEDPVLCSIFRIFASFAGEVVVSKPLERSCVSWIKFCPEAFAMSASILALIDQAHRIDDQQQQTSLGLSERRTMDWTVSAGQKK